MSTRSSPLCRLLIPLISGLVAVLPCSAQPSPVQLTGVVTDAAGAPIGGVEITLLRDSVSTVAMTGTRSVADGTFGFERVAQGIAYLKARRLGYRVHLSGFATDTMSASRPLRIVMSAAPIELESVRIDGQSPSMKEFDERRRKRGTGRFIDRREIEERRPANLSEILQYYPGMAVRPTGRLGNQVRVRGCKPSIWIDGIQAVGAELDDVVRPSDVDGMEIYGSWSGVPPQFADRGGRSCGAILVWTRIR